MNLSRTLQRSLLGVAMLSLFLSADTAFAAKPQLDNGGQIVQQDKPYDSAQTIPDIFSDKGVYGKLDSASAVDIFKFVPEKDGEQTISLLGRGSATTSSTNQPLLVLLDPTQNTSDDTLQLPLPAEGYHTALVKSVTTGDTYYEPLLLQRFNVLAKQKIKFSKGKDYYLVVIQPYGMSTEYALKTGEGKAWTVKDVASNPGTWIRLQTDNYAGTSPFSFSAKNFALLFFFLGLAAVIGTFIFEHTLSFIANRRKSAAYLLVKLQPYSRFLTWIGLWFTALGAYMHFDRVGWIGLPFVMSLIFVVLLVSLLYQTLRLSPQIRDLEVTKREATIPLPLRKRLIVSFAFSLVSILGIMTLLSMYFLK